MIRVFCLFVLLGLPLLGFKYSESNTTADSVSTESVQSMESSSLLSSSGLISSSNENGTSESVDSAASVMEAPKTTVSSEEFSQGKREPSIKATPAVEKFFITISNENYVLLEEIDGEQIQDNNEKYQKTFAAHETVADDGTQYYQLFSPEETIGYINATSAEIVESQAGKLYPAQEQYASITSNDAKLFSEDFHEIGTTKDLVNRTFKIEGYYNHHDGKIYYVSKDSSDRLVGIIEASAIETTNDPSGKKYSVNDYYSVVKDDQKIFKNIELEELGTTTSIFEKTFNVKEWYYHFNGKKYYSLYDNTGTFTGIVEEESISKAGNQGGIWHQTNQYITITKNDWTIWNGFNFSKGSSTKNLYQRTYRVTGYYHHFNGAKYLSVYDSKGIWKGYLNEGGAQVVSSPGGLWYGTNQYVTITKNNWTIWSDFNFSKGSSTKNLYQRTYRVTGYYHHFNGSKYFSVYDSKGKWLGYLNKDGTQVVNNQGGKWNGINQYITVTKNNWTIWKDFNFNKGSSTKGMYQRTYRVTGWYRHYNGSKYLSVYDNKGKWLGYLNEGAAQIVNNQGGKWNGTNQYITVTKNNWTIWKDFNFNKGSSTKEMYQRTYRVTGWYRHFNGAKYLSLYDNNGKWQGYLNEGGAAKASGAQGTGFSMNKSVLVIKNGYSIWSGFNWKEKARTNSLINKTYQVKWYYKHMNGSTYYSLYESNGKWFGYVNSGAVRERRGVAHYLGTSRQRVLNELNAHQNDRFYLGTPFRLAGFSNPEMFLVPNGVSSPYGPGMNCTGFVATVTRRSGGNLNRISGITSGVGGYVNAYNWRDALMRNTEYYSFSSIDALLKSGKAQKGDLIYLEAMFTDPFYDCHIGIFWGNRSNENRFWHQVIDGNKISHIYSGTRYSKVYLFPQD
ncbi:hypothetical protein [Enterococcus viikkiensis]|nr:hypothetical protein [Enterococcus viikkiensis]